MEILSQIKYPSIALFSATIIAWKLFSLKPPLPNKPLVAISPQKTGSFTQEKVILENGNSFRNITSWLPSSRTFKGIVLVCHGLYEHSLRYDKIACELNKNGFAVFGIDHVGHGLSDGSPRGFIKDHTILSEEFVSFANFIYSKYGEIGGGKLPVFILSHSMGTLVAIHSLLHPKFFPVPENSSVPSPFSTPLSGVVFSATGLMPGLACSPFGIQSLGQLLQTPLGLKLADLLAWLDPLGGAAYIPAEEVTSDEAERLEFRSDPLRVSGPILNRTGNQVIRMGREAIERALPLIPTSRFSFLCLHGRGDRIGRCEGSRWIFDHAGEKEKLIPSSSPSTSTHTSKRFLEIIGENNPVDDTQQASHLKHEIFHERQPESGQCVQRVIQFFNQLVQEREQFFQQSN